MNVFYETNEISARPPAVRALIERLRVCDWASAAADHEGWRAVNEHREVLDPDAFGHLLVASSLLRIVVSGAEILVAKRRDRGQDEDPNALERSNIKSTYDQAYDDLRVAERGDGYSFLQALYRMGESRQAFFKRWMGRLFAEAARSESLGLDFLDGHLKTPYSAWLDALDQLAAGQEANFEAIENDLRFAALAYVQLGTPWETAWMSCDVVLARTLDPRARLDDVVAAHRELAVYCRAQRGDEGADLRMGRYLAASRSLCTLYEHPDVSYLNRAVDLLTYGWDTYAERHYVKIFKLLHRKLLPGAAWNYRPVYAMWRSVHRGLALSSITEYEPVQPALAEIAARLDNARLKTALDVFNVDRMLLAGLMESLDFERWEAEVERVRAVERAHAAGSEASDAKEPFKELHAKALAFLKATCLDDVHDLAREIDACRQNMGGMPTPSIRKALIALYERRSGCPRPEPQVELELTGNSLYAAHALVARDLSEDMVRALQVLFARFDRNEADGLTRPELADQIQAEYGSTVHPNRLGEGFKSLEGELGRVGLRNLFQPEGGKNLAVDGRRVASCVWDDQRRDYSGVVERLFKPSPEDLSFKVGA